MSTAPLIHHFCSLLESNLNRSAWSLHMQEGVTEQRKDSTVMEETDKSLFCCLTRWMFVSLCLKAWRSKLLLFVFQGKIGKFISQILPLLLMKVFIRCSFSKYMAIVWSNRISVSNMKIVSVHIWLVIFFWIHLCSHCRNAQSNSFTRIEVWSSVINFRQ